MAERCLETVKKIFSECVHLCFLSKAQIDFFFKCHSASNSFIHLLIHSFVRVPHIYWNLTFCQAVG